VNLQVFVLTSVTSLVCLGKISANIFGQPGKLDPFAEQLNGHGPDRD
jgi:hypothetical protein